MTSYGAPETIKTLRRSANCTVCKPLMFVQQLTTVHGIPPIVLIPSDINPDYLKSTLILSSYLRIFLLSSLFPSGFPPATCKHLSSTPYVLHSSPISSYFDSIKLILFAESPHYAVFSSLSPPVGPKHPPHTLTSNTLGLRPSVKMTDRVSEPR
jgi:hypothetical protein